MHRLFAASVLALTVACGKPAAKQPPITCAQAVEKMMALQGDRMLEQIVKEKQALWRRQLTEVMTTACEEDHWPSEVLRCAVDARDQKEMDACGEKVGKELQGKMMKRVRPFLRAMTADVKPSAAPAPTTDPAAPTTAPAAPTAEKPEQ
jgi:hypothetical protein